VLKVMLRRTSFLSSRVKRIAKPLLAPLGLGLCLLMPTAAHAQTKTFSLDRLMIAGGPVDGVAIWRPDVGVSRIYGQVGFGYAHNAFRAENHVDDLTKAETLEGPPVEHHFTTYFTAGADILERGSVQLTFPLVAYQSGYSTGNNDVQLRQYVDLKPVAPGDMRLDGRFVIFRTESKSFKIAARGAVFLPTGNDFSFAGDTTAGGNVSVAAEYASSKFFVTANVGFTFRPRAQLHEFVAGRELTYGIGGYVPLLKDRLRIGAEIFGSVGMLPETLGDSDAKPLEWSIGARYGLDKQKRFYAGLSGGSRLTHGYAPDFRIVAMIGGAFPLKDTNVDSGDAKYVLRDDVDTDKDGFFDYIDMCVLDPEDKAQPNPDDGCPTMADTDNDGIPDGGDKCKTVAEDKDGVDDRDGCPEDDADKDGIPDNEDMCPKEPGQPNTEDPSKHGCPVFVRRIQGSSEIEITKQVEFEFDKAVILPKSFPILDEVVRLLKANPEIKLLSIEGHTDNVGITDYNEKLSAQRAAAVVQYLINRGGIAKERLVSKGWGARKPKDTNDTDEGRAKNRRVEFHIVTQAIEGR
jgi:OmpA-OmpF porin, OOP family